MKIILHIGTHKTGTSALQSFLNTNYAQLSDGGIFYPASQLGKSRNQFSHLATMLKQGKSIRLKQIFKRMRDEAQKKGCDTILLSGEEFSTLNKKSVDNLKSLLINFTVEVIVFFRNVYDFVVSAFVQINKRSKSLANIHRLNKRLTRLIDYDRTLNTWTEVFGNEAVSVHSYDLHRHEIISYFLGLLPTDEDTKVNLVKQSQLDSYASVNVKVDPLASFIMSIMGFLSGARDYDLLRRLCEELKHNDKGSEELQRFLAKSYLDAKGGEFEHPKLKPIREYIIPDVNSDISLVFSAFSNGEYLYLLGKLLMVLSLEYSNTPWYKRSSKKSKLALLKSM